MKLFSVIAAMLLPVAGASAQVSIPLLDRVPGHRVTFDYTYSLSKDGKPLNEVTSGKMTVEDNAFNLSGLGIEIYSDGVTRWSIDREAEEVLIETVEADDIIANPAILISSYKELSSSLEVLSHGKDSLKLKVTFDDKTYAVFSISRIVFTEASGDKKDFTLDVKSLGKSYVITDLREAD